MPDRVVPISPQQRRLWLLHSLHPRLPLYNGPVAHEIRGELDVPALEQSIRALISRHAALRTGFSVVDDQPVQVVAERLEFSLPVHDLRGDPDSLRARVREAAAAPFDLERPGVFDFRLFRSADEEWTLLLNLHHIVTDGWSNAVIAEEIGRGYADALAGRPPAAEEPGHGYAEYGAALAERLADGLAERQLAYWSEHLSGAPDLLRLPLDRPRPARQRFHGELLDFALDAGLAERVRQAAARHRTTDYVVLLAAFTLLMHTYTGERDVVVGAPVSNRDDEALDRTVGFFVNILPLRSRSRRGESFSEYLQRCRATFIGGFRNQAVPFDEIVKVTGSQGSLGYSPLVQAVFGYHQQCAPVLPLEGLRTSRWNVPTGFVQTDLEFDLARAEDGSVAGIIAYDSDLFDETTIARLGANYRALLEGALADPQSPLDRLELRSAEEIRFDREVNATAAEFPADACLHELFEAQVERTPDDVAVVSESAQLSYRELDARAEALARRLRACGIGPERAVGICLERSVELVVGLLGILKAGGAYLPLDPASPPARIRQILADAAAPVLLVDRALGEEIDAASVGAEPLDPAALDPAAPDPAALAAAFPPEGTVHRPHPENLVSVYYTSGSTGMPKGVASRHRGWVNRMVWMQRRHRLARGETVLHKTTLTFDDSALEIFWPLSVGGRVAVLEPGRHRDPLAVLEAATRYESVYLQVVPSMLSAVLDLVEQAPERVPPRLRNTTSSGEALTSATVERFHRLMPGALHNTWGATEVSIDSTCHTCGAADETAAGPVSLGRPFDNNTVHVLDRELRPVPVGVVGDLYIGGLGLARGYLNDPARTAGAFLPDPFRPGERLYRTGDQGFLHPDGGFRFVGRSDHQVKIRGMRVELGEIETVLLGHPQVKDAVVVIAEEGPVQRLVAFVTAVDPADPPGFDAVREHAKEWLPHYMIPVQLVVEDSFPLNANGKVDRRALKVPEPPAGSQASGGEAPRTPSEQFVAGVWRELLGVERIGAEDGFFVLGGHSLVATRFTARVRQRLGVEFPLVTLYSEPTVRATARTLEELVAQKLAADEQVAGR
ncbi:non-ribosomal peptide synthetase [Kitasatospora aureofaciens]|uniref:non-ribosomal peptide synthetase n=1 Tax=Kitasatospora aureofaciens TaxID=1894 RepID=UPI00068CD9F7|nr:non-ribosomal peptide synthetase [Kitasatospora aureofaciens]